jgi:cyclophilin family peptidyl-prolyl cis-trans isomerase
MMAVLCVAGGQAQRSTTPPAQAAKPANPVMVLEVTGKGTIEAELFRADAPRSVDHLVELIRRDFYRGFRFHRVLSGFAQVGDPQTRDVSRKAYWGSGGSGNPIGVAEISKKYTHQRGTIALAHSGDPRYADCQFYIMKIASPGHDGKYTIVGKVTTGMAVVDKLEVGDIVKSLTLKGEGRK